MSGILGKKIGMTRMQRPDGRIVSVTLVLCEENTITQVKTAGKDGYSAIVVGTGKFKKPRKTVPFRWMREFKIEEKETEGYKKGDVLNLEGFKEVKKVEIDGVSKGKGFQGTIKRYHFRSGPGSHGSHFHREPGSVGMRAKPGRIMRGKKMPGRMGLDSVNQKNVEVMHVDPSKNLIALKGSLPGANGSMIIIKKS
ncbi:MAG: 50S ribosomal protein L3 [Patescibacteria group bacterium]